MFLSKTIARDTWKWTPHVILLNNMVFTWLIIPSKLTNSFCYVFLWICTWKKLPGLMLWIWNQQQTDTVVTLIIVFYCFCASLFSTSFCKFHSFLKLYHVFFLENFYNLKVKMSYENNSKMIINRWINPYRERKKDF